MGGSSDDFQVTLQMGVPAGVLAALAACAAYLLSGPSPDSSSLAAQDAGGVLLLLGGLLCIVCGALAARETRRIWSGAQAALWAAILWGWAILPGVLVTGGTLQQLQRAPNGGDIAVVIFAGLALLLCFGLLGLVLGALGGLVGRFLPR